MYRALRRYHKAELVEYRTTPSSNGPDLKVYRLTEAGQNVLRAFLERNLTNVFYTPQVRSLIEKG